MEPETEPEEIHRKPELVLIIKSDVELRARPEGLTSAADADISPLSETLEEEDASVEPSFREP
jgi:hypothetical protein